NLPPIDDGFVIDFCFDGLPLYLNDSKQFWPILMKVFNIPNMPVMPVALFFGLSKPASVDQYLEDFVEEINELQKNGLMMHGRSYWVKIRCIIADTPARAYIKGVKSHNSVSGCLKCTITTKKSDHSSHRFYPYAAFSQPRDHNSFYNEQYPLHQKFLTALSRLYGLNMILDIIVSDRLHLIDEGVLGRLIFLWTSVFPGQKFRMSKLQLKIVSEHLLQIHLPSDFRRQLRSLNLSQDRKGIKLKSFLHSLYGPEFVNSNVHNLLHAYEEVFRFGELDTMSSVEYEEYLRNFRQMVLHSKRHSLAQSVQRFAELQRINISKRMHLSSTSGPASKSVGRYTECTIRPGLFLRDNFRDQWCMLHDGTVLRYESASIEGCELMIHGHRFTQQYPFFL
uniref:Transposase domain-containing protein n=1 Tax=Anopheles quadriannulatus TaxID=34691 RepID=A0A182XN15_ANOQN